MNDTEIVYGRNFQKIVEREEKKEEERKKKSLFQKLLKKNEPEEKKEEEEDDEDDVVVSTSTDTMFRDYRIFIPETMILLFTSFTAFIIAFLLGQQLTPIVIMIGGVWGIWLIKFMFFTPTAKRPMVLRYFKGGAVRYSVDGVKNNKIKFSNEIGADEVNIVEPKKHWDYFSGKPLIVLRDGDGVNVDLFEGVTRNKMAKDYDAMASAIWGAAQRDYELQQKRDERFLNSTNILLIIIILAIGFVAFLVLRQPDVIAGLVGGATATGGA